MLAPTAIKKQRKITIVKGDAGEKKRTTYTLGTQLASQNMQTLDDKRK